MENIYLIAKSKNQRQLLGLFAWIFTLVFTVTGFQKANAQECVPVLEYAVHSEVPTADGVSDGRIRVSGLDPAVNYLIQWNEGSTFTGANTPSDWTTAQAFIIGGEIGHISNTLPNPATNAGTDYTFRVYEPGPGCYHEITHTMEQAHFNDRPDRIDLKVTMGGTTISSPGIDQDISISITVTNDDSDPNYTYLAATGVLINVYDDFPGVLIYSGQDATAAPGTTFTDATGVWDVGTLNPGETKTLVITYTMLKRGVYQITSQVTQETSGTKDINSEPSTITPVSMLENDEAEQCVSAPFDYCAGDEFNFELASGDYTDIIWVIDGNTYPANVPVSNAQFEITAGGILIIKGTGTYNYSRNTLDCPITGCCPIVIEPGVKPNFSDMIPQGICLSSTPLDLVAVDNTDSTAYPTGDYDSDRGDVRYQWYFYNTNTTSYDSLIGQTSLIYPAGSLPDSTGSYLFRIVGWDDLHKTCRDTTEVEFEILDIEQPVANATTPICEEETLDLFLDNPTDYPVLNNYTYRWTGPKSWDSGDLTVHNTSRPNSDSSWTGRYYVNVSVDFSPFGSTITCAKSDSVDVIVNPLPVKPNPIDLVFCQYQALTTADSLYLSNEDPLYTIHWIDLGATPPADSIVYPTGTLANSQNRPFPNVDNAGNFSYPVYYQDVNTGCIGHDTTQYVRVWAKPEPPVVTNYAYCEDADISAETITATDDDGVSPNDDYRLIWFGLDSTNVSPDTSDTFFISPLISSNDPYMDTIWVGQALTYASAICPSYQVPVVIEILDRPEGMSFVTPEYCINTPLTIEPLLNSLDSSDVSISYPGYASAFEWNFDSYIGPNSPTPDTASLGVGSHYGTVTETYTYTYSGPDNFNGSPYACTSDVLPIHVVFNPMPEAEILSVDALCLGNSTQDNGTLILNRFEETDDMQFNSGSSLNTGDPIYQAWGPTLGTPAESIQDANGGIFATTLPNPTTTDNYFVRVTNRYGCTQDLFPTLTNKPCVCPGGYCEPATVTPNF